MAHLSALRLRSEMVIEVRSHLDFHDRLIIVDDQDCYHVGASMKDAGNRAFMISRIQDEPIFRLLKDHTESAWNRGQPVL